MSGRTNGRGKYLTFSYDIERTVSAYKHFKWTPHVKNKMLIYEKVGTVNLGNIRYGGTSGETGTPSSDNFMCYFVNDTV